MAERHLTAQRRAAASPAAVWAVFADFPNLADHWDGLKGAKWTSPRSARWSKR
jgi:hypothetical protein